MSKITLMVGISGSGKSTQAKKLAEQTNSLIVSRDKIREMLFGYAESDVKFYYNSTKEELWKKEQIITDHQNNVILKSLKDGKDVIVDNTNLQFKYIKEFIKKFHKYEINFYLVECSLEEAVTRDKNRVRVVGEPVITKQYEDLQKLKQSFDFKTYIPQTITIFNDPSKKPCVIFDIDGTLALKRDRNAFDWENVGNDDINIPVLELYFALKDRYDVIICSGRDMVCENQTQDWLQKYNIEYKKLHMRDKNDTRPDWIIKQEMWEQICKDYYIAFMVDDRNQVVDHARDLGFVVFQVAEGNF